MDTTPGKGTTVIGLIRREGGAKLPRLALAATGAGLANALILILINLTVEHAGALSLRLFLGLLAASILYILGARYTYARVAGIVEGALHQTKMRIIGKIEQADLEQLELIGGATIQDRLLENAAIVTGAAEAVGAFLQCIFVLIATSLYIAWLSWPAFLMLLGCCLGLRAWYRSRDELLRRSLRQLATHRVDFFGLLSDLLRGFKEVKLSPPLGRELGQDIERLSKSLGATNQRFLHVFNDNWIALESWRCVLISAVVFVLPLYTAFDSITLHKLVAALLFFFSPLSSNILNIPSYVRVNEALAQIDSLEAQLDGARSQLAISSVTRPAELRTLAVQGLEFSYGTRGGAAEFRIGPIDLSVTAGQVVFIVGGNGSGKSTLLKLLTGLYQPTAGTILVDGSAVRPQDVAQYRELYSAIFADFHLFEKLYGMPEVKKEAVDQLLQQLRLGGKVAVADDLTMERNLSTGQRKRLAMLVALLEDRPVYVFDEWAADQDPEFRRYFYEDVLSTLRRRGKMVLVVSHDDQYFHCADQLFKMEYGLLRCVPTDPHRDQSSPASRPGVSG